MALGDIASVPVLVVVMCVMCQFAASQGQEDSTKVAVKWGVADSTATVGRLFRMHIPSDAFSGDVLSYTVSTPEGNPLPSWLEFDTQNSVLQGIPTPKDTGQLFLEITARGASGQVSVTFAIFVRDVPSHTSGAPLRFKSSGPEFVRCKQKEPETVATIIIDADLDSIPVGNRVALLKKFLSHMELLEDMVKMVPVGNSPLQDTSALVSGTGDCQNPQTSGLFISWPVGCGQVKEGHFPVLQRLDDDSGSGRMAKVLGHSIIGWYVTNSHIQAPSRKRRQVQATATMAMTPVMPTKTDTTDEKTDDMEDKMTHKMIETQSPTFIQPTATQPPMTKTEEPATMPTTPTEPKTDKVMPTEKTTKPVPTTTTEEEMPEKEKTTKPMPPVLPPGCDPQGQPEVKMALSVLRYNVGEIIEFMVPEDTFSDCQLGNTRQLHLKLYREKTDAIPDNFFVQFDEDKQKIFGLPGSEDKGRYSMNLVALRPDGQLANTEFTIVIRQKMKKKINHELSVTLDYDYDKFMSNVSARTQMANNVASVYGDSDASNLIITRTDRGSVIYGWTNSSLSGDDCPSAEITELVRKLVNEDGSLTDNAIEKMKPFRLTSAASQPKGECENDDSFPTVVSKPRVPEKEMGTTKKPMDEDNEKEGEDTGKSTDTPDDTTGEDVAKGSSGGDGDDDIWITTVVPAVVIVVILLIALLIACILYRKKRKGKMNVEEQNTFINKGAPVIFPDELEDKPSDVNKPLLVEGSPAPPEYHRGTSESPEPNTGNNHRSNGNNPGNASNDDGITEMPEKPYEPPPPVMASSNNKQPRPTHQQQPLSQPPQILP